MGLQLLFKDLQSSGGAVRNVDATTSKARSALSPVRGMAGRTWSEELGDPLLEWGWSGLVTHTGA